MHIRRLPAVRAYLLAELWLSFGFALGFTVSGVYFVREVGMDPLQLVLTGTAMEATIFVFEVPTGVLADTVSRRLSLLMGWAVMGLAFVAVGLTTSVPLVLAAYALWGLGYTFTSGAYEAWITDEVGAAVVGPVFARGERAGYVGALAGVAASVGLAGAFGLATPILLSGVLVLLTAPLGALLLPETGFRRVPRSERETWRQARDIAVRGVRLVRRSTVLGLIVLLTVFAGMSTETFDRLYEAQLIRNVGLPEPFGLDPVVWFGVLDAGAMLLGIAGTTVLARRLGTTRGRALARLLLWLSSLQLAAAVAFGLAEGVVLAFAAYWLFGLTRSLINPTYMTWLNQQIGDSTVRATVISFCSQADAIGQAAGGPVLGAVGRAWGIRTAILAGATCLTPALVLYGRAARRSGAEAPAPAAADA
jgi:DHA3 family tetracycline resistance protein-like MFS transporter